LALLALEAGAERVYACETNPVLANMAQAIVAAHGGRANEAIVVINKASQELSIGEGGYFACAFPTIPILLFFVINGRAHRLTILELLLLLPLQSTPPHPPPAPDLPAPVDVVVTELVDSGLLGEHILPVLRHARAVLLRPGGRTIPHSGALC
jgi:hypothetical protein